MTDEELLQYVETKTIEKMLYGCEIDDHLGYKGKLGVGSWSVSFRADIISRLIDMAREAKTKETVFRITDEEFKNDKYA